MSASHLTLLRDIVANIHQDSPRIGAVTQSNLDASPYVRAKHTPTGTIGIRKEAAKSLIDLTEAIYNSSTLYQRGTRVEEIYGALTEILITEYLGADKNKIAAADLDRVQHRVWEWFTQESATYHLYIPCILPPRYAPPFTVGPVSFRHQQDFVKSLDPSRDRALFDAAQQTIQLMTEGIAYWMAEVEIGSSMRERARELGALAVDLALVGIELVTPYDDLRYMARLNGRTVPRYRATLLRSNDTVVSDFANQIPGLSLGDGLFAQVLTRGNSTLNAVGQRITAFLSQTTTLHSLEQAWVDAAHWFREGLTEPLNTVAVTKLETAIEVLLRAESTHGSKARLLTALEVFFGLTKNQLISPTSTTTVKMFIEGLVTDRSRILHGTWSTLTHEMRESRANLERLAGGLLVNYVVALGSYAMTTDATDNIEKFLAFARSAAHIERPTS
jgi:hypothetical protein